jgi:hypothetical protein
MTKQRAKQGEITGSQTGCGSSPQKATAAHLQVIEAYDEQLRRLEREYGPHYESLCLTLTVADIEEIIARHKVKMRRKK